MGCGFTFSDPEGPPIVVRGQMVLVHGPEEDRLEAGITPTVARRDDWEILMSFLRRTNSGICGISQF